MDKNGGNDAINIARSITKLSNRKAYVVSVIPYLLRIIIETFPAADNMLRMAG